MKYPYTAILAMGALGFALVLAIILTESAGLWATLIVAIVIAFLCIPPKPPSWTIL